jgi:signal transduction histidine kinase/ActR/RegA family two-component response regulator
MIYSGHGWNGELRSKKKDGTVYWDSVVVAPIFDEDHNIKHLVAITEDISEKKQMIEELRVAKEKAEESDRLKSVFLANMSHEIRTPLNGILGFSNIICSGEAEAENLEMYGKIIENSGRRLLTVIDDIIDISKIQANQLKIYYGKFNINDLINELYVFYRTQNAEKLKNVELKFQLCRNENHNWVYSDKNRVYQVLRNLIDNAFKFTLSGGIVFGCSQSTDDELTLFVKDTGIGIEPDKQEIIFQSFRQAQEGKSRKYDGSGLGLSIVTGIMDMLGGKIHVVSELGEGSVFYVSLPRNKEKIETATVTEKPVTIKESNTKSSKLRIVSVEDDKASIEYLKIAVQSMGYELVNFNNAQKGIEYLKGNKVDLVLMDVQLPEMNGFEATRIIKAEYPNLPVIIQTAYAMKTDMEKAYRAGCDDYLSKPLSLKQLKEKIKKYIDAD